MLASTMTKADLNTGGPVISDVDGKVPLVRLPSEVHHHVEHSRPDREASSLEHTELLVDFSVSDDKQVGSHL